MKRQILWLLGAAVLLFGYVNCSGEFGASGSSSSSSTTSTAAVLSLSPSYQTIGISSSLQFYGSGGTAPYTYSILSGAGTIVASSGYYTAPAYAQTSVIQVTDIYGRTGLTSVYVSTSGTNSLSLSTSPSTVLVGSSALMTASGGTSPYTYTFYSGNGSVSDAYFYPTAAGPSTIKVTDAAGLTSYFSVTAYTTAATVTYNPIYRFSFSNGIHFFSNSSTEGTSAGGTLDGVAFNVLTNQSSATVALYRCYISSTGTHFVTTASGCQGYTQEGTYGYVYTTNVSGTSALYGFYNSSWDYLYSKSYYEGINAGYTYYGIIAYVY